MCCRPRVTRQMSHFFLLGQYHIRVSTSQSSKIMAITKNNHILWTSHCKHVSPVIEPTSKRFPLNLPPPYTLRWEFTRALGLQQNGGFSCSTSITTWVKHGYLSSEWVWSQRKKTLPNKSNRGELHVWCFQSENPFSAKERLVLWWTLVFNPSGVGCCLGTKHISGSPAANTIRQGFFWPQSAGRNDQI